MSSTVDKQKDFSITELARKGFDGDETSEEPTVDPGIDFPPPSQATTDPEAARVDSAAGARTRLDPARIGFEGDGTCPEPEVEPAIDFDPERNR